jgi:hypothetical protein
VPKAYENFNVLTARNQEFWIKNKQNRSLASNATALRALNILKKIK